VAAAGTSPLSPSRGPRRELDPYRPPEPAPLDLGPAARVLGQAVADAVVKAVAEQEVRKAAKRKRRESPRG
jgi:hypothetical protein